MKNKNKTKSVNELETALREALSGIDEFMTRTIYRVHGADIERWRKVLERSLRNCDVGTPEEQSERFDAHCRKNFGCLTCQLREKDGGVPKHCEFEWAQMPYEEGGAK